MLVIFSKLTIQAGDREWIDSISRAHDPQHDFIAPHFTFVFPFTGISFNEVSTHARKVAEATQVLDFRLSRTAVVDDPFSALSHVFLLPVNGADKMRELHARLYSGVLAPKLHPTLPFLPHMTVGAFERHEDAERAANSLESFDVQGSLDAILIAEFDGKSVTELQQLSFG